MYDDARLPVRFATDALALNAWFEYPQGWHAVVRFRRANELWRDAETTTYDALSSGELLDVLAAELAAALGL